MEESNAARDASSMNATLAAYEENVTRLYIKRATYYLMPILIIFGVLGNTLSAYVILKTKLRKLSSSLYLLTLATNDSIILLTIGIQWLLENAIDVINKPVLCECITYVSDLCGSLSVWLIVVFTAERFVVVKYPLRSKVLCTVTRAKTIIAVLLLIMSIVYSPVLLIAGMEHSTYANGTICTQRDEWRTLGVAFNTFDLIFTCVLPVAIISTLNSVICRKVWIFSGIRRKMTDSYQLDTISESARTLNEVKLRTSRSSYKMTKMLLIISTVSLCMILPSYIIRFVFHLQNLELVKLSDTDTLITVQLYMQFLYYLTFGINFALYCISGQNFRKAVAATFCRRRARRDAPAMATENRTQSSGLFNYQSTFRSRKTTRLSDASV